MEWERKWGRAKWEGKREGRGGERWVLFLLTRAAKRSLLLVLASLAISAKDTTTEEVVSLSMIMSAMSSSETPLSITCNRDMEYFGMCVYDGGGGMEQQGRRGRGGSQRVDEKMEGKGREEREGEEE